MSDEENAGGMLALPSGLRLPTQNPEPKTAPIPSPMLVHTVYFWLQPDLTEAQRADFRRGVESLGTIKAVEKIYVGTPAKTEKRPIIDDSYSVALTVICQDIAAHDAYQADPIHHAFINQFRTFWSRVQIYDAE
jgi:hypothetical protein